MKLVLIFAIMLIGCASSTGVIQIGPDRYSISQNDNGPASSLGNLKAASYREASAFCATKGKQMQLLSSNDTPRSFGQFPATEVQFSCV